MKPVGDFTTASDTQISGEHFSYIM